jgi:hypothetical protein
MEQIVCIFCYFHNSKLGSKINGKKMRDNFLITLTNNGSTNI